jgi:ATP-dependent Clp protease, protease subunit
MMPLARLFMANKGKGSFRAEGATLWLYDVIASSDEEADWFGGVSPRAFIEALAATSGPVTLRINSPGGSVFGAQAMVAAMRTHGAPITAQIDSLAASAASVIAAEAAQCVVAKGGRIMIHKAWAVAVGNSDEIAKTATLLDGIDAELAATYARRAGSEDVAPWMERMAAETWFTADQAVQAGLADAVIAESTQRPQARWDLSAFLRAPEVAEDITAPAASVPTGEEEMARRRREIAARLVLTAH